MLTPELRIAGIGEGLFLIFLILGISLLVCFFTSRSNTPYMCTVIACVLVSTLLLLFVYMPKEDLEGVPEIPVEYDDTYLMRVGVNLTMVVFVIITLIVSFANFCLQKKQGKKIRPPRADMWTAGLD